MIRFLITSAITKNYLGTKIFTSLYCALVNVSLKLEYISNLILLKVCSYLNLNFVYMCVRRMFLYLYQTVCTYEIVCEGIPWQILQPEIGEKSGQNVVTDHGSRGLRQK